MMEIQIAVSAVIGIILFLILGIIFGFIKRKPKKVVDINHGKDQNKKHGAENDANTKKHDKHGHDDHHDEKKAKPAPWKDQGGWILLFICLLIAGGVAAFYIGRGDIHLGKKNKVDKEETATKPCEATSVTLVSKVEDNIATITMDANSIKEGYVYRISKIWLDGKEIAVSEADGAELYTNTLTEFDFGPGETYILSDFRYNSKMYEGPIKTRKLLFYWYDSVSIVLTGECQQ